MVKISKIINLEFRLLANPEKPKGLNPMMSADIAIN
jgi:hypothetical protein